MNLIKSLQHIKSYRPKALSKQHHGILQSHLRLFKINNTQLSHSFKFEPTNQQEIFHKMQRIGYVADEMDHHPEWFLKKDELRIQLSTHQISNQVSIKDYILAYWIEDIMLTQDLSQQLINKWNQLNLNIDS